jgi:hypothetical protein
VVYKHLLLLQPFTSHDCPRRTLCEELGKGWSSHLYRPSPTHYPLTCQRSPARNRPFPPSSGRRNTKPLAASVPIRAPLSVKPGGGSTFREKFGYTLPLSKQRSGLGRRGRGKRSQGARATGLGIGCWRWCAEPGAGVDQGKGVGAGASNCATSGPETWAGHASQVR